MGFHWIVIVNVRSIHPLASQAKDLINQLQAPPCLLVGKGIRIVRAHENIRHRIHQGSRLVHQPGP
jgi:hypothetical protein